MGHGEGHGKPYEVPDWRTFRVEDAPQLVQVQKMLAQKGLKDPWLRNEAWRYNPASGTQYERMKLMFRGFKWGLAAALLTVGIEKMYNMGKSSNHGGHH